MQLKHYIAVKSVDGKPMSLGEYNKYKGWTIPENENPEREGYLVVYPDNYESWSPKEAFDLSHMEISCPDKISIDDLDRFIGEDAFIDSKLDEKTTLVKMTPRTGFVQYEVSSCVDPNNYSHEIGVSIATARLKDKLWPLLGFVLQWAKYGLKKSQI